MIGSIGAAHLAAHQIALNLASISYMIASGIGSAAMISLGYHYGKGDVSEIRKSGFSNFILVLIIMSISAFVFIAFRNELPTFYVESPEVIGMASMLLIIAGFFLKGNPEVAWGTHVTAKGTLFKWMFTYMVAPMQATMFALLAFFVASASSLPTIL